MVEAGELNPNTSLATLKLLIPHSDRTYGNGRNAEVRYTAGTRTNG